MLKILLLSVALSAAVADLAAGRIVAVKGLGGYHLACDATDETAVRRLRDRKRRWAKPFAVMVADLPAAERLARVGVPERALLDGPERPILLLRARGRGTPRLAPSVAAGNHRLGIFLPYTPLHHLLCHDVGRPLVMTSGNRSDEPIAVDDEEARDALKLARSKARGVIAALREQGSNLAPSLCAILAERMKEARDEMRDALEIIAKQSERISELGMECEF